ncbi:MAG: hypothetical protein K9M44_02965 [Candidatus Pacebacteria bacterium]|nr:hypothetical protein [Candidatus Paceibacterota bacterium]
MTLERWQEITGNIKDNFEVLDLGKEKLEEEDGGTEVDYIVFDSGQGKFRLEFISKPVVLDKKTLFSKRIGSETKVDYVYSDSEKVTKMIAYRYINEEDRWEEIDPKAFS